MSAVYHPPKFILIGRIVKPHGVRGEVLIESFTDVPERFLTLKTAYLSRKEGQTPTSVSVTGARFHNLRILLKLKDVNYRDQADHFRGQLIQVPYEDAVPLDEGEFFLFELYGMSVVTDEGEELGSLKEIIQTGANDVFVVQGARGEVLIPDTEEVVLNIDRELRQITVHLIPGLID